MARKVTRTVRRNRSRGGTETTSLPPSLYRYVWQVSGRSQIFIALLSMVVFLLDLVPLELQRRIVNDAISKAALSRLVWLCLAYAVVVVGQGGSKLVLNIWRSAIAERTSRHLRIATWEQALCHPHETEGKEGVGLSIILAEADPVGGFVGGSFSEPILHAGVLLSVFIYMLVLQPWMALVAFAVFAPQFVFVPMLQEAINRRTEKRIRVMRTLSIDIVGNDEPATLGSGFRRRANAIFGLNMAIYRRKFGMNFLMNALYHFGIVGILFVGGWFVMQNSIRVGTVVAFISGLNRVNDPWGDLVNYFRELTNARVKYDLIARVLDAPQPEPARAARA
jgi:ABC-type bacteriocin/lantibiotic exporter with double-glycine peptidase domain